MTETGPQTCVRCVCDTDVAGISFDAEGVCNFCHLHDELNVRFPIDERGKNALEAHVERIKAEGQGKPFDCVVGVSGGRDSTYLIYLAVQFGLRPLAVHFNDGFGNPVAGENMTKVCKKLGVELRFITSDWRESKDLKIAFLKSSTPDLEQGTDIGIGATLYAEAAKEGVRTILLGHSYRNEGIMPLAWSYLDGRYLKSVHKRFGDIKLRTWKPFDAGFHLDVTQVAYYTIFKRIRVLPVFYFMEYRKDEVGAFLTAELGWTDMGAKYYDDLYQSLMAQLYREKFNIDRRRITFSAHIREGQMTREEALEELATRYEIGDEKVVALCIKRLGLSPEAFAEIVDQPVKTFRDYPTNYTLIRMAKWPIWLMSRLGILPSVTYLKYFHT